MEVSTIEIFAKVAKLKGISFSDFLNDAMIRAITPYCDLTGGALSFHPVKGFYVSVMDDNTISKIPCYILSNTSVYGRPYATIIIEGLLEKVPVGQIEFDETDEEEMLWNRFKDADDEVKAEVTRLLLQGMPDHGINDLPFK